MQKNILGNKIFASAAAVFCCALWGISTPVVKTGYPYLREGIPSIVLYAGVQFVLAGLLTIFLACICAKRFVLPGRKSLSGVVVVGLFQTALQYMLMFVGLAHTTAVKGTILKGSDTFFSILITCLVFHQEKLTAKKLLTCALGFAGVVIVNLNGLDANFNLMGDGLVLLSVLSYSLSISFVKQYTQSESPLVLSGYQMLFGGALMAVIGLAFGGRFGAGALPAILSLAGIYATTYALWNTLLKYNPISMVELFGFVVPVCGVLFSTLVFHEEGSVPPMNIAAALLLICAGIIIYHVNFKKPSSRIAPSHEEGKR